MRHPLRATIYVLVILLLAVAVTAQVVPNPAQPGGGGKRQPAWEMPLPATVAAQRELSVVLGRPTVTSITLNILSASALEGFVEYAEAAGDYKQGTALTTFPAGTPTEVLLGGLKPDTAYSYRLQTRTAGQVPFTTSAVHSFHTQRAPGSTFTFAIQGDSHPERPNEHDATLYAQTLGAVAADKPDFYLTIGDDFSVDTLRTITPAAVKQIYQHQRLCLSLVGQTAPLFLVNGNHEQAARCNLDGTAENVAVWAQNTRNAFFPEPAPDAFYTGDAQPVDHIGLLRDYYAWTWGDALFVVIDPYWHSALAVDNPLGGGQKTRDLWESTIGDAQYQWLQQTLAGSMAKYKFVFTHHVLGTGRGGIEEAGLFEWGGYGKSGAYQFPTRRPGWPVPLQQLFVKNGVTAVFQGHDHIFVHQVLDGIVYQSLPEPADPYYALYNADAYLTGDRLPSSGYVRVAVAAEKVTVEYVREYLPQDEAADRKSGAVAFSYTIPARKP